MKSKAFLQGWAALNKNGIYSARDGFRPWEKNQKGAWDVRRAQVHDKPFTSFGKLQIADRLAFGAASLALSDIPADNLSDTGISMGSAFGSLSTDIGYMQSVVSGFPRPAYFSATLPSSPVAEIAIHFGLKGANRVIVGGACPGLNALDCAFSILNRKKARRMLVLNVCAMDEKDLGSVLAGGSRPQIESYAFILSAQCQENGINMPVRLEGKFLNSHMTGHAQESYFFNVIEALVQTGEFFSNIDTPDFQGQFSVEKGA
jgi:hypothetical protein